jgi:hypothetical protein
MPASSLVNVTCYSHWRYPQQHIRAAIFAKTKSGDGRFYSCDLAFIALSRTTTQIFATNHVRKRKADAASSQSRKAMQPSRY